MALSEISNTLTYFEPFFWAVAFCAFLRARNSDRIPAFGMFLGIRAITTLLLSGIYHAQSLFPRLDGHVLFNCYSFIYWDGCFLSAIAVYFTLQQIFKYVMSPLPGLSRMCTIGFRWAAIVSVIAASAAAIGSSSAVSMGCTYIAANIGRCLSIIELCLLAFLALAIHSLGLNFRSRAFGISLGLGMMAAMDLVVYAFHAGMDSWPNYLSEIVTVATLGMWAVYLLVPEPARLPAALNLPENVLQWNDLAKVMGDSASEQAALATAQHRGFLQSVEGVVDRVLAKNSVK